MIISKFKNISDEMEILNRVSWINCSYLQGDYERCTTQLKNLISLLDMEEDSEMFKYTDMAILMISLNNHYSAKKCLTALLKLAWQNLKGE